jgi:hypothetical protein
MPRLARLRLVSVGHANARFRDVVLDFRDAAGRATDSTIWLRNGGGKSSIVSLLFSLVRPGLRDFLGVKSDGKRRQLKDYVQSEDRAVIAAEWELDAEGSEGQGDRAGAPGVLLTGVFCEWRSGGDDGSPRRLYFSARPRPGVPASTLEGLPLHGQTEGRRVRLGQARFHEEWGQLRDRHPEVEARATLNQREWADLLRRAGIDPEVYQYQLRMNQREGGADEIFRFPDHESFVDFLLELAFEPAQADEVSRNVGILRDKLRRRVEEYLPELVLVKGLEERLAPVATVAEERAVVATAAEAIASELWHVAAHIERRLGELGEESVRAGLEVDAARAAAEKAAAEARAARGREAQLRLFAATELHGKAVADLEDVRGRRERADRESRSWSAAVPLRELRRHDAAARDAQRELDRKVVEFAPLRADLGEAARVYAAALRHRIQELSEEEGRDVAEAESVRAGASELRAEVAGHREERGRAEAEQEQLERRRTLRERARARLETSGALASGESGQAGGQRHTGAIASCQAKRAELEQQAAAVEEALERARAEIVRLGAKRAETAERARQEAERLSSAAATRSDLEHDARLLRVLELPTIDLDRMPDATIRRLDEQEGRLVDDLVRRKLERARDDRALRHLEARGLAPPGAEVEQVVEALRARLPAVWSGWEYLAQAVGSGERRACAVAAPELAGGVIVRGADLARAEEIAREAGLAPELPVVIGTQANLVEAAGRTRSLGFVVGPRGGALYDRSAAATELARVRQRADELASKIAAREEERAGLAELVGRLRAFRASYSAGYFAAAERRAVDIGRDLDRLAQSCEEVEKSARALMVRRQELISALEEIADQSTWHRTSFAEIQAYVRDHEEDGPRVEQRLLELADVIRTESVEIRRCQEAAEAADRRAGETEAQARQARERRGRLEQELGGVVYVEGSPPPVRGSVDELRARYERLRLAYEQKVGADYHQHVLTEAQTGARRARGALDRALAPDLEESDVARTLDELADTEQVEERQRAAHAQHLSVQGLFGNQTQVVSRRTEDVRKAEERCADLDVMPLEQDDRTVVGPSQAMLEAEAAEEDAVKSDVRAREEATRAEAAEGRRREVDHLLEMLQREERQVVTASDRHADLLGPKRQPADAFAPPTDRDVAARIEGLDQRCAELARKGRQLDERRERAARDLRAFASSRDLEGLRSPVARRFVELQPKDLEELCGILAEELATRRENLEREVADLDKHRALLVTEALQVAEDGLRLLEQAARRSKLPDHLPGLGGGQFLRVSTSAPDDPGERRGRIGELVDEMAQEGEVPTGIELIQRAVRRLARPIRVRVLFPDAGRSLETVEIPEMARFSGGEQLTCAILLYCTLAQLRARTHRGGRRPSSVLVLDNPIGRASRPRFLELQREVARAMGVQLVYTTGVNDFEALRVLPNIIRLRNDRIDRNTGHALVEAQIEGEAEREIVAARVGRVEQTGEGSAGPAPAGDTPTA